MNRMLLTGLLGLTLLVAGAAWLPLDEDEARKTAARAAYLLRDRYGYTVRDDLAVDYLAEGASTVLTTTLYTGNHYVLVAGGDSRTRDIDVFVYDENNNLVAQDDGASDVAFVEVTPRWTGTYYVKVHLYDADGEGAHWALVYGYR